MNRLKLMAITLLALAAFPLAAKAQAPSPSGVWGPKDGHERRVKEIYNQLDLTEAQKSSLEANKQQHKTEMNSLRQALRSDREMLMAEIMKPQLDMARIKGLQRDIISLMARMEENHLSSILAVRSILTPEQFARFSTLIHQHRQGREQNNERGPARED